MQIKRRWQRRASSVDTWSFGHLVLDLDWIYDRLFCLFLRWACDGCEEEKTKSDFALKFNKSFWKKLFSETVFERLTSFSEKLMSRTFLVVFCSYISSFSVTSFQRKKFRTISAWNEKWKSYKFIRISFQFLNKLRFVLINKHEQRCHLSLRSFRFHCPKVRETFACAGKKGKSREC